MGGLSFSEEKGGGIDGERGRKGTWGEGLTGEEKGICSVDVKIKRNKKAK